MNTKKALASIVALAALYCGAAYVSGYLGEKNIREQLELSKSQPQASELDIQLVEYRRGIFTSDVRVSTKSRKELPKGAKIEITVDNAVRHGPLLFADGPAIGALSAISTVQVKTGLPEEDKKITDIFGSSIGTATSVVKYNGDYRLTWVLPSITYKNDELQFALGESRAMAEGNTNNLSSSGDMTIGRLEMTTTEGGHVTMSPTVAKFTTRNVESGLNLSDVDGAIAEIDVRSTSKPPLSIKGLTFNQVQTLAGASINSSFKLGVAKLSGPVELENAYYTMDLNGVSKEATRRLATLFQNQPTDPEQQQAFFATQLKEVAPLLLQNGLSLKLAIGASFGGGTPQAQWLIQYKAPTDGRDIFAITDPLEYLQLADSTLLVKAPATLVPAPLIAQFVDAYIVQAGSEYVLRASLQDGALKVGKTPIPKEMLAAMLAGMNKEKQPPAAQPKRRS